jgi:hypothetical protein
MSQRNGDRSRAHRMRKAKIRKRALIREFQNQGETAVPRPEQPKKTPKKAETPAEEPKKKSEKAEKSADKPNKKPEKTAKEPEKPSKKTTKKKTTKSE